MTTDISTDFIAAVRKTALDYAEQHQLKLFGIDPETGDGSFYAAHGDRSVWEAEFAASKHLGISAVLSNCLLFDVDVHSPEDRDEAWAHYAQFCGQIGLTDASGGVPMPYAQSKSSGWHFAFRAPVDFGAIRRKGHHKLQLSHFRPLAAGEKDSERISVRWLALNKFAGSVTDDGVYQMMPDAPPPHAYGPNTAKLFEWYGSLEVGRHDVTHAPPTDECTQTEAECEKLERFINELLEKDRHWFEDRDNRLGAVWGIKRAGFGRRGYEIAQAICDATPSKRGDRLDRYWYDPGANAGRKSLDSFWKRCAEVGIKQKPAEIAEWRRQATMQAFAAVPGVTELTPAASPPLVPNADTDKSAVMPRGSSLMGPRGEVIPIDADESLALEFAADYVDVLRHCEEMKRWFRWDETRWAEDKTSRAYYFVREHLRRAGSQMHFQEARKILSAKTVAAVERMAKTDPRIAVEASVWDADPWLLNTPGGVVDLRTCIIREARSDDYMTRCTAAAPGGECPAWEAFLNRALAGDTELIAFVQRMLGYSLTGDTSEQALFFLYGQGGNGKGVLLNTVAGILADYAKTAPMATFTDSPNASDRHPTDLAGLRGARFVMASETEKGRKWAEAKIKALTGGDPIAARFMGRDFFEYTPQFKLLIAGNHKPRLGTVDEAIRRRMNMIPFTVQIPVEERDHKLPEKLRAEWGGILQWMITGCMAWQKDGLRPPPAVLAATQEYLSEQDAVATWLDERCEQEPQAFAARTALFASWSAWAIGAREPIGNATDFYQAMTNRGFQEKKREGVRGFVGVKIAHSEMPAFPKPNPATIATV